MRSFKVVQQHGSEVRQLDCKEFDGFSPKSGLESAVCFVKILNALPKLEKIAISEDCDGYRFPDEEAFKVMAARIAPVSFSEAILRS